jgi:3-phosphoshikimate 1-carboxyvinyltransferase
MTLATTALFAEGPTTLAQHCQLARQGNRPHRRDGHRVAQAGCGVEPGRFHSRLCRQAGAGSCIRQRSTPTTTTASPCASRWRPSARPAHQRPADAWRRPFPTTSSALPKVSQGVPVIAIDGTSASGKGTIAARVAQALGWHYLDSGALYRLTALAAGRAGIGWDDEAGVAAIAADLDVEFAGASITLSGEEVSDAIRSEEISAAASRVAALPAVRAALLVPAAGFPSATRTGGRRARHGFGGLSRFG